MEHPSLLASLLRMDYTGNLGCQTMQHLPCSCSNRREQHPCWCVRALRRPFSVFTASPRARTVLVERHSCIAANRVSVAEGQVATGTCPRWHRWAL